MRVRLVLAASMLGLVPAAAAASGGGGILFSAAVPGKGSIVLVRPDGTGLVNLTPNESSYETDTRDYSWSPDGSQIVFSSHRDGPASQEIYVMNADGSAQRRLTFDSGHDSVFNIQPVWSPDGATIAFVHASGLSHSVWLMRPDGSERRELVNVGAMVERLTWSPDSTRLLYDVQNAPPTHVEVVDVRTGMRRSLTPPGQTDFYATWSPDGRSIAMTSNPFARTSHIDVVDSTDGSRRTVSSVPGTDPAWSPDGSEIAFVGIRTFPEYADRYGSPQRLDLFVVGADGMDQRRLTGPLDDDLGGEPGAFHPSWWPDGSRLFFHSGEGIGAQTSAFVVNADGSCEQRFGPPDVPLGFPAWRPLSAVLPAPARCADIRLDGKGPRDVVGLNAPARLHVTVSNDGNLTATGIRLEISASAKEVVKLDPSVSCAGAAPVICTLPPLPSQRWNTVEVDVSSPTAGLLKTQFAVTADEPDNSLFLNRLELDEAVLPCVTVGSKGADDLEGTNGRDSICARGGADRIDARAGNDFVDAGSGDDTVIGGPGRDVLTSGPGRDVILVRDGRRDRITCGTGRDVVVADRLDRVAVDCEKVFRVRAG
jgi:Tol biopolymer transport system component